MPTSCFHCNEVIPSGIKLYVTINQKKQPMCCIGCQAVAQTIVDNNLTQYYQFRTEPAQKGAELVPEELKNLQSQKNKLLNEEMLQSEFIYQEKGSKEAILTIEGINCAACAWLIEMQLTKLNGIHEISVNATTQRATLKWQDNILQLSEILDAIEDIGYQALPFKANEIEQRNKATSKVFIKRLGISGILMMQIMMIAVGLYFGAFSDMDEHHKVYLRWVSFILAIPIVSYGAFPFYIGAINALKIKRLSMDVPVSIAIILAFTASAWATITEQGEVYFESVSMFTFLLLIGKFLEFRARSYAAQVSANLLKLMPMTATRLKKSGSNSPVINETVHTENSELQKSVNDVENISNEELVAAKQLIKGDLVLIKPGEVIPADGIIITGASQINEAMLSGEQTPVSKKIDDIVFAGTINGDGNLTVKVQKPSSQSFLSQLIRLSEKSQAYKPKLARFSDKVAQYFVAIILLTAIGTALYWHQHLPEEAFWITLSVLVATCPCALSLATPTALTCATTRLNRDGIMIKSAHVMETMPKIDCFAFDKTGTLTTGEFAIDRIEIYDNQYTKDEALVIAAALESHSEHPLAKPFKQHRDFNLTTNDIEVQSGQGVTGVINDKPYRIGKASWLLTATEHENDQLLMSASCVLVFENRLIAAFYLVDKIREDAHTLLRTLNVSHQTMMLSGDNQSSCDKVGKTLSVTRCYGNLSATDKMSIIKEQQKKNINIAMIGDGVNDSPVFGAAHVSMAMGCGTDIAKSGADVILLNSKLTSINTLNNVSIKTKRIIFQNYLWAFGYNAIVLPLAVAGYITPYMAVIGMSVSSILVISNSLRLLK
jgi:Cu2+-exporting ATPase